MDFTTLKKIFPDLILRMRKSRQTSHTHYLINAHRDWIAVLSIFAAINILVAGFSAYIFFGISKGEIFLVETPQTVSVSNIDRVLLSEVLFVYEEKKRALERQKIKPPVLADPSREL